MHCNGLMSLPNFSSSRFFFEGNKNQFIRRRKREYNYGNKRVQETYTPPKEKQKLQKYLPWNTYIDPPALLKIRHRIGGMNFVVKQNLGVGNQRLDLIKIKMKLPLLANTKINPRNCVKRITFYYQSPMERMEKDSQCFQNSQPLSLVRISNPYSFGEHAQHRTFIISQNPTNTCRSKFAPCCIIDIKLQNASCKRLPRDNPPLARITRQRSFPIKQNVIHVEVNKLLPPKEDDRYELQRRG